MTSVAISTPDGGGSAPVRYVSRYRRKYTPKRRARTTKRRVTKRRVAPRRHTRMSKFVLANIDPFNSNAEGAKIPDSNTYPSAVLKVEDETTTTSDATYGLAAQAWRPYPTGTRINATAASSNSWTWTAAYGGQGNSTRLSSITSNFSLVRPVAHGIRIYAPTAPTSTTGFLHVAIVAQSEAGTTWAYPTSIAQMNNCMFYQRFPLAMLTQKSVTVVNKFLDASATRYVDPSFDLAAQATDLTFHTEGWAAIILVVEGAPVNTGAVVVEQIVHLEAIPLASGVNTATPAAPFNISSLEAVSRVAGHTPAAVVQGEEQGYMQQAMDALGGGAWDYLRPYAYQAGRYAAHAGMRYVGRGIAGVTTARLQSGFRGGLLSLPANQY